MATRTTTTFGAPTSRGFSVEREKTSGGAVPTRAELENRGRIKTINIWGYGGGGGVRSLSYAQFQAEQAAESARQAEQTALSQTLTDSQKTLLSAQKKEEFKKVVEATTRNEIQKATLQGFGLSAIDRFRL